MVNEKCFWEALVSSWEALPLGKPWGFLGNARELLGALVSSWRGGAELCRVEIVERHGARGNASLPGPPAPKKDSSLTPG